MTKRAKLCGLTILLVVELRARLLAFGSAQSRSCALVRPLVFGESGLVLRPPAVHLGSVQLQPLAAIAGLFAQLVEAPGLLIFVAGRAIA